MNKTGKNLKPGDKTSSEAEMMQEKLVKLMVLWYGCVLYRGNS